MINNLDKILNLLNFESEDDFYFLQILKRKKEHPELGSNSYVIKTYYIRSKEDLQFFWDEIVCLCTFHNARAGINLNKRSFEKTAFHTLKKVTDQILNKDFKSARKAYTSVCGTTSNEKEKKWIIDIDEKSQHILNKHLNVIAKCGVTADVRPKIYDILETKNGFHIITSPFRVDVFKHEDLKTDIHKDNPTILYIP